MFGVEDITDFTSMRTLTLGTIDKGVTTDSSGSIRATIFDAEKYQLIFTEPRVAMLVSPTNPTRIHTLSNKCLACHGRKTAHPDRWVWSVQTAKFHNGKMKVETEFIGFGPESSKIAIEEAGKANSQTHSRNSRVVCDNICPACKGTGRFSDTLVLLEYSTLGIELPFEIPRVHFLAMHLNVKCHCSKCEPSVESRPHSGAAAEATKPSPSLFTGVP